MEKRIFTDVAEAERFRLQKVQEGFKTSITVATNYVTVSFSKKVQNRA